VDYFNRQRVELLEEMHSVASSALAAALELQAARTGDTRYHALFDGGVVPIILTDVHGVIQDVNQKACDFLGYPRSALVRVLLSDIYTAGAGAPALTAETLLPEGTQETSIRTTLHDVDGKSIPSLVRVRRVRLDGRMVIEWVFQDVTAQTELEQLRKDLSAMVYHDLRAPLTNIVGSIYKLNTVLQNHENPIVPRLLHIGLRSTRQLQRMVDSLLDIQRLEEGKALLNRQPVEVRVLLADAVQLVQPIATEAGQQILFEAGKDVPTVALDSDMIMRVIINLMENAVKYTPTAGSIRVTAHRDGDGLLFKVSDSGPGIPKEMLGRVFDKFSRVRHQGAPKGVGLGLAFCRLAVEAHGGKIWVESEPGHGSDFMFRLPIVEPAPPEAKVATPPEEARPEPEKPRSAADTHPVHPRLASA
jgi:PAS domain S-box-containing protein